APPPRALSRFLARSSEGNPFFVAEYLRLAVNEEHLSRRDGRWSCLDDEAEYAKLPMPSSLRAIALRRLAHLGAHAHVLLSCASVLGRDVDPSLLAEVASLGDTAFVAGT